MKRVKRYLNVLFIIIALLGLSVIPLFGDQLYDLCYFAEPMKNGEFLFVRYRNPLLDPLLRTYEMYVFNPGTGKITSLQQYGEKSYLLPVVSPDRSTITYHSLIEGNDFLVTRNIISGRSTRLRFDTSGYFLFNTLHFDNETVASVLRRGIDRQAIYVIYNDLGTIKRLYSGQKFREVGFLYNASIFYVDHVGNRLSLGVVRSDGKGRTVVAENVEYVEKAPGGEAVLYSIGTDLFLYRVFNNESIALSNTFSPGKPPLMAADGAACVVYDDDRVLLVNIPSGDVLYQLTQSSEGKSDIISRYTFYTVKDSNRVLAIHYKKPGQQLREVFTDEGPIRLLGVSPDDRYILYQFEDRKSLRIYDRDSGDIFTKRFDFTIEDVIVSPFMEFSEAIQSIYIIATSPSGEASPSGEEAPSIPVRELYMYNYPRRSLTAISTAEDTDLEPYLRDR
jgi:WD40 repeat protein